MFVPAARKVLAWALTILAIVCGTASTVLAQSQAANPAGAKFCMSCGQGLAPAVTHCTECGTELPGGARFCANCGTRVGG